MGNTITREENDNLETFRLIWLDSSVNRSEENLHAQWRLRTIINYLKTFEDEQTCLEYIRSVPKDDRIILIVSGRLGRIFVPKIAHLRQIDSIYIYCKNKAFNEYWAQYYYQVIKNTSLCVILNLLWIELFR